MIVVQLQRFSAVIYDQWGILSTAFVDFPDEFWFSR